MFGKVASFLDSITMYRLMLYGLLVEFFYSLILGIMGQLPYRPTELLVSAGVLVLACLIFNTLIARFFKVAVSTESSIITALILYFVLSPLNFSMLVLAALAGMVSKYLVVVNKKHIFNPAAMAMLVLGPESTVWWVGLQPMLPIVLIVGLLIVAKLRRYHMVGGFLLTALFFNLLSFTLLKLNPWEMMMQMFTSWPAIFFGTIMLTEPLTTPPTKKLQSIYGVLVGMLYGTSINIGSWYWSPEFKLLIANLLSFGVSFRFRIFPELVKRIQLAHGIYELSFSKDPNLVFSPGQFMEWTLPHDNQDGRGLRRYFTLASSPTERDLKICVRLSREKSSSFKLALLQLTKGQRLVASNLQGDFVLPYNKAEKLVFIAGGIGITPFRSMVKYLHDKKEKRSIILIYVSKKAEDIVYRDVFEKKSTLNLKLIYVLTESTNFPPDLGGRIGRVDEKMVMEEIPDYLDRTFFLSGPSRMVDSYKGILKNLGVNSSRIITDYFPGY